MALLSILVAVTVGICSASHYATEPPIVPGSTNNRDKLVDFESEQFRILNEQRAKGGSCPNGATYDPNDTPLIFDCKMWKAAQGHSQDMADKGYFSHTSPNGDGALKRLTDAGAQPGSYGENIAAGQKSPQEVHDAWMNSDGHCRNMLSPHYKYFAVGYALYNGKYGHYWTQNFGSSVGVLDQSCLQGNSSPVAKPTPAPVSNPSCGDHEKGQLKGKKKKFTDVATACDCRGKCTTPAFTYSAKKSLCFCISKVKVKNGKNLIKQKGDYVYAIFN